MWVFTLFLRLFMADESAEGRIDAGAVEDVHPRLDAMVSMSLRYVFLAASRLVVDSQAGRNEPPTVFLIKGSLVTIFGMCLNPSAVEHTISWDMCQGKRSVEDCERG